MNQNTPSNSFDQRAPLISPKAVSAKLIVRSFQPLLGLVSISSMLRMQGYKNLLILDSLIEDFEDIQDLYEDNELFFAPGDFDTKIW
jgi:hypothetical protein